ncbi:MFS transporter [Paenibacillus sp. sptzw28]|uniref:MFS transporter n=1 Tax=Paenibacillus sp. sptzw28 TaxID=715179 RepID=UPI001C6E7697|nr:MFS transporter [Paenibacillus sp. sptzw28]QYR21793.1 MFS transporter [Paenibacillus sp. sptzw28]
MSLHVSEVAANKKIPAKRWLRIIPPIILIYIFSYMDKVNIGFAIAGGMDKALGMTATVSGIAGGVLFFGYIMLQVPGGLIAHRRSAKKFIGWSVVAFSLLAAATGLVQEVWQLLVIRFLIGVAEGGVLPAVLVIINNWFPNEERGRATSFFIMNNAIGPIITGPLSGLILIYSDWRSIFFVEGLLSLVIALACVKLISDRPEEAKWISKEERDYITGKLREEQQSIADSAPGGAARFADIFKSMDMWKLILIYFFYQTGIYGFALWLPSLIKQLTHSGMGSVGILSIFPYIGTAVGLLIFGALADKSMNRKLYTILPMIGFALCLFLSVQFKANIWVSFGFLIGCGVFIQSASSVFWTIPSQLFSSEVAAGSRGVINAIGNLGGFLGPYIVGFLTTQYNSGIGIYSLVVSLMIGAALSFTLPGKVSGSKPRKQIQTGLENTQYVEGKL